MVMIYEKPAKALDRGEREQRQLYEDVRTVEPGQPVEDRPERPVRRREADPRVLEHLGDQECGAQREGGGRDRPGDPHGCCA